MDTTWATIGNHMDNTLAVKCHLGVTWASLGCHLGVTCNLINMHVIGCPLGVNWVTFREPFKNVLADLVR